MDCEKVYEVDGRHLREAIELALSTMENAYAPYSGIKVGASVISDDGRIYSGCNIENASYGLTQCAERNAIASAIAHGAKSIIAVIIVSELDGIKPCGACLQVISEFASSKNIKIYIGDKNGEVREVWELKDLLPQAFCIWPKRSNVRAPRI